MLATGAPKSPKRGVWGPWSPPKNIFFANFRRFIHLCGLSAFQCAFTRYFMLTLSRFMMFFVKLGFLVKTLGILYKEIRPKRTFFYLCFWNLKWLQNLVLRHLPQWYILTLIHIPSPRDS